MDETQQVTELKSDILSFLLQRNITAWQTHQQRLGEIVATLKALNIPEKTPDGKETQGAMLIRAFTMLHDGVAEMNELNNSVMEELSALSEQYEIGNTTDQAITKILKGIRATNPKYATMSDDDIKQELGFESEKIH